MAGGPSGSTLPAWKQALLERRRRPGDPTEVPTKVEPTPSTASDGSSLTSGSTWKQTALGKKLQRYTSPAHHDRRVASRPPPPSEGADYVEETPEVRIESTGSMSADDLVEERLLPIKQNPILLSDRKTHHKVKPNHTKTETDRRSGKPSPSPESSLNVESDANGTLSPLANRSVSPTFANQQPGGDDSGDEVFNEEMAYGKGFVHKLLQKFINLSGKDEPPSAVSTLKPLGNARSSGENLDGKTRNSGQHSNCDGDESSISKSSGYIVTESFLQNGQTDGLSSSKSLIDTRPVACQEQNTKQLLMDTEELPQNIVSATRDIFEHSGSTARKKPAVVEKLNSQKLLEQTPSKKRPAPKIPSTDTGMLKADANLNKAAMSTVSIEKPSDVTVATKSESQLKSQQDLPMNRILYSASGTKRSQTQENSLQRSRVMTGESATNAKEKTKNRRERSVEPPGHIDKQDSDYSVEVRMPNVETDLNMTVGKVSSLVGSWGLKNSSRTYDSKPHRDDRASSQNQVVESVGVKASQILDPVAETTKINQRTETGSRVNFDTGSSVKKETNSTISKSSRSVEDLPGGMKVKVDLPSDNFEPIKTRLGRTSQDSRSSRNESSRNESFADISNHNGQLKLDMQTEIEKTIEIDRMKTRIRVGGHSAPPQIPSSSDTTPARSVPAISSKENQVTLTQIGEGAQPPTVFLSKTTDTFENSQSNIISGRKKATNEFDLSQNDIKNASDNKADKNDNSWEDPFVKFNDDTGRKSDSKSPSASRPGKLLVRPSSNHPSSKTKSEFLTMTNFNDIKTGEFAPARRSMVNQDELVNGDAVDHGRSTVEELLDLEQFVFIGGGVVIGRSILAKTKRGKKLRINFDDSALQTYEYPSEQILMAEFPSGPGYCDYLEDEAENLNLTLSSGLLSSPALAAGERLSSYAPRSQAGYALGIDRLEDLVPSAVDPEPQTVSRTNGITPDSSDSTTFSKDSSADLLF